MTDWNATTDWGDVCCRAGGRRHYNAWRHFMQARRRCQVAELLPMYAVPFPSSADVLASLKRRGKAILRRFKHGAQAHVARELGVSESTISRDVKALDEASNEPVENLTKKEQRTAALRWFLAKRGRKKLR